MARTFFLMFAIVFLGSPSLGQDTIVAPNAVPIAEISGIYPSLAMYNQEGECGTGAVVPWGGRLWVVTYAPHMPKGSSDKLYEISPNLQATIRPESIGGTPANRMVHLESKQLFIGPYVIDQERNVRVIPYSKMFGRPTGNARHLTDPARKIYLATMEEGLYEIDVADLSVRELWTDEQIKQGHHSNLPGYHGKGLYSGQGQIIYANNGDHAKEAMSDPSVPSGVLATWDGSASNWDLVRRNQFTEVTGPGGIFGNASPENDPIWSIGWDHRSLILMVLDRGKWHSFRLPKASHSYDGAHGWNTEWPRIRNIGTEQNPDLLMTMHGMFWRFPIGFSPKKSAGIRPRSAYMKVIGDFCRWNDRVVLGCDDTAKSEFLNKRKVKGGIEGPGQSHSNLWFVSPETLDRFGPTLASGAVWQRDQVMADEVSEPFLFQGWQHKSAHFINHGTVAMRFQIEIDIEGKGQWTHLEDLDVPAGSSIWNDLSQKTQGEWIRIKSVHAGSSVSVHFAFSTPDVRPVSNDKFTGLATVEDSNAMGGLVRARGDNKKTLQLASQSIGNSAQDHGSYELDANLKLVPLKDPDAHAWLKSKIPIPRNSVEIDESSLLIVDDRGRRWRFPKGQAALDELTRAGQLRICREVATERDMLSLHGTFYELPAENADGFAKIRPIASHSFRIMDYCSYRGLLVLTGIKPNAPASKHVIRSEDGNAAVWVGAVDDLWDLGKPIGSGGPWSNTDVKANTPSDPYLFWGFDQRSLHFKHDCKQAVKFQVEIDLTGEGLWVPHHNWSVEPNQDIRYVFPKTLQARWLRFTINRDCRATAHLEYR